MFELNSNCKPEVLDGKPELQWTKVDAAHDVAVGEEVTLY